MLDTYLRDVIFPDPQLQIAPIKTKYKEHKYKLD